jgi:acetoin utilization protein AcuB
MENGKLIGIITETNIFDAFIEIMGITQKGFRVNIKISGEDHPGILAEITKIIASCGGNITHANTYGEPGQLTIAFRIHAGNEEEILSALRQSGYECTVHAMPA